MEAALTPEGLAQLISKPDTGLGQTEAASGLIPALEDALRCLPKLPSSFAIPDLFETATAQFWWADGSLAGFNPLLVEAAFDCIKEYNALPAGVGCAAIRQRLSEQRDMKTRIQNAIMELQKVKI